MSDREEALEELQAMLDSWEVAAFAWHGREGQDSDERAFKKAGKLREALEKRGQHLSVWRVRDPADPVYDEPVKWIVIAMGRRDNLDAALADCATEINDEGTDLTLSPDFVDALKLRRLDQAITYGESPHHEHFAKGAELDRMGRIFRRES